MYCPYLQSGWPYQWQNGVDWFPVIDVCFWSTSSPQFWRMTEQLWWRKNKNTWHCLDIEFSTWCLHFQPVRVTRPWNVAAWPGRKRGFLGYRGYDGLFFSNFYKSVFSIFTIGEYRKHGCLKTSDFFKSQFSIFTRQMFEIRDFQTSVWDVFDIYYSLGEYRKHGCLKTSDFFQHYSDWGFFLAVLKRLAVGRWNFLAFSIII